MSASGSKGTFLSRSAYPVSLCGCPPRLAKAKPRLIAYLSEGRTLFRKSHTGIAARPPTSPPT